MHKMSDASQKRLSLKYNRIKVQGMMGDNSAPYILYQACNEQSPHLAAHLSHLRRGVSPWICTMRHGGTTEI